MKAPRPIAATAQSTSDAFHNTRRHLQCRRLYRQLGATARAPARRLRALRLPSLCRQRRSFAVLAPPSLAASSHSPAATTAATAAAPSATTPASSATPATTTQRSCQQWLFHVLKQRLALCIRHAVAATHDGRQKAFG